MQKFSAYQQYGFDLIEYKYKRERKVNIKKLTSYLCILSLLFSVCTFSTTADNNQYRENLLNYYAAFLDGTYEQLSDLVSETPSDKLNLAAISIIQGLCNEWQQKYPQRAENEIELDLDEYAEAFGLDLSLIESHAAVLNANYYKEVYDVFNARKAGDSDARLDMFTAQQAPEITPFSLPSSLNNTIRNGIHTGNILLTKDSVTLGVRHGHAGIVQDHISPNKWIGEAVGDRSNWQEEVISRHYDDYWPKRDTISVVYPTNTTTQLREKAGAQTLHYANGDYKYEVFSTKANMRKSDYLNVNCAGIIYRVYWFMASVDVCNTKGVNSTLYPSSIYNSTNVVVKSAGGTTYETTNWNDYTWIE